jgi:predicted glycosyltransferase
MKRVLFISGSVGLGHVGRDLEIVGTLRKLRPKVEVSWMAESPASYMLQKAGEKLLPETSLLYKANEVLEESAKEYQSNLVQWAMSVRKGWAKNCEVYSKVFESYKFDLLIGDET